MQVVKASSGHFPQPFLISDVKRTGAKIMTGFKLSNFFLKLFCKKDIKQESPDLTSRLSLIMYKGRY
jgi:hypothetical protein